MFKFSNKNRSFSDFFLKTKFNLVLMFHVKFSTVYFSVQFLDNLAYDLPKVESTKLTTDKTNENSFLKNIATSSVYFLHFYLLKAGEHITFWFLNQQRSGSRDLNSLEDLFYNSNWAEREVSEMNGVFFFGKNDNRNLLLGYSEFSYPLKKHTPSIGFYNLFYDIVSDSILKVGISKTMHI